MENNTQNTDLSRNDGNTMLDDVKIIWHNPENRKPLCYQIGVWDGKRSDNVLVELKNGNYVVAVCYEGIIDGCRSEYHPTEKPVSLVRYLIEKSSQKGDLVLDTFAGSFSTARACKEVGRDFICFEIEPDYCKTAKNLLNGVSQSLF